MCVNASVYKQHNLLCIFIRVYLVLSKTPIQQLVDITNITCIVSVI